MWRFVGDNMLVVDVDVEKLMLSPVDAPPCDRRSGMVLSTHSAWNARKFASGNL